MKSPLSLFVFWACLMMGSELSAQQLVSYESQGSFPYFYYTLVLGSDAKYNVEAYKITYTTTDLTGAVDTASGLVTFPDATDIASPLALVQHGTVSSPDDVPSNLSGGYELGAFLTSAGYIAIQADYLGLGVSGGLHPYVHAASEASAGIDMIFATKELLDELDVVYNDQLFVTGYSQGGHAAMAAHRSLQQDYGDVFTVTASAPMSGPYSISTATKERILSDTEYFFPGYAAWTLMSYNEAYSLYDSLSQYLKEPYAEFALSFKNGEIPLDELHAKMIDQLTADYGGSIIKYMFQDSIVAAVSTDDDHPLNVALRDNDTYDWAPQAPTRLYYCMSDDQVAYTNSVLADSVMNANGAPDVQAIDVAPGQDHGGCILPAGLSAIAFFKQYAQFTVSSNRDLAVLEGMNLFPNPTSNSVQLTGIPDKATLQVYDLQGRMLRQQSLGQGTETVQVTDLTSGMYLFRVTAPKGVWNKQVLVR